MKLHIFIIVLVFAFSSCAIMQNDKSLEIKCDPPPLPKCEPKIWSGIPFDTTEKVNQTFLRIRKIRGADSDSNEWKILMNNNGSGIMTIGNSLVESEQSIELSGTFLTVEQSTPFPRTIVREQHHSAGLSAAISSSPIHSRSDPAGTSTIYMSSFVKIGFSDTDWSSHPTTTPDKRYLFFASNRDGGFGGTDIWFSRISNDTIFTPINCGPSINTPCDEICPFISEDGTMLLFSSAGHETLGGYDIMISELTTKNLSENSFLKAKNFGAPLNTPFDEIFPTSFSQPKTLLFYSSNQPKTGTTSQNNFDMYVLREFQTNSDIFPVKSKEIPFEIEINRTVRTANNLPVQDADVTAKNTITQETISQTKSDKEGKYSIKIPSDKKVELMTQKDNTLYYHEQFITKLEDKYHSRTMDITLPNTIALRINFPNDIANEPYTFILDSNGVETQTPWQSELDIVADNIKMYSTKVKRIELVGHTDDVASDAYNKALALRRVKFIEGELIKRGVKKNILTIKSEGKQQPLKPRNGEDIEIYRKRLRRVELTKIIE
ncbi:MAG: OmpA family protein [Ignavibacteria bacterium]|nr:OmpA family protein [Ignavibacteria bacterium]